MAKAAAAKASTKWNLDNDIASIQGAENAIMNYYNNNETEAVSNQNILIDMNKQVEFIKKIKNNVNNINTIDYLPPLPSLAPSNTFVKAYQEYGYAGSGNSLLPGINPVQNIKSLSVPNGYNTTLYSSDNLNDTTNLLHLPSGPGGLDPSRINSPVSKIVVQPMYN
jgi:hypothetical protein